MNKNNYLILYIFWSLSSPNYPDAYYSQSACTWTIAAKNSGEKVFLEFTHFDLYFETKPGESWTDCSKAHFVQIFESLHPAANTPKYCGSEAPDSYASSGDTIRLIFDASYGGENKVPSKMIKKICQFLHTFFFQIWILSNFR